MSVPAPKRDARGRLLPGFTANPSGRPAIIKEVRELAREHVPDAIKRLAELVNSPNETIALAAIDQLLNRVYGKPVQAVESEVRKFDMAQLYLAATQQANGVVDVTPSVDELAALASRANEPATANAETETDGDTNPG
jgi:hypothetical protein